MPQFFVDRLEAPSLSTLHLISDFDTIEIDPAPQPHYLLNFFRRDGSSLTALKLNIPHLEEELLVEAVRLLPSLENLEISMMMQGTVSTTLIMLLLEQKCEDNGGEFVLCPRLAHIRFPLNLDSFSSAMDLLDRRWDPLRAKEMRGKMARSWRMTFGRSREDLKDVEEVSEEFDRKWNGWMYTWIDGFFCDLSFGRRPNDDVVSLQRGLQLSHY